MSVREDDGDGPDGEPGEPGRLDREEIYDGRIVRLGLDRVRFPDGSEGELELVRHDGASAVLPLLGSPGDEDPELLLVRQYRYAAGGELFEVPAGMPDPGDDDWEACARREMEEETGYRPGTLTYMTRIYTTPGFCDEVIRLYAAWDLQPGSARHDADEFLEPVPVRFSRALEMVRKGEIVDAKSAVSILYGAAFVLGGGADAGGAPAGRSPVSSE